jgi:predicted ABC-type ATPase
VDAATAGYNVVLCFIGIADPETSEARVAMRVSQGGHDVPSEKLASRFRRTIKNLKAAIQILPIVLIFDNDNLADPFRRLAEIRNGKPLTLSEPIPEWLRSAL